MIIALMLIWYGQVVDLDWVYAILTSKEEKINQISRLEQHALIRVLILH